MTYASGDLVEREQRRLMKENAHLYWRHDAHRFVRPDAARFFHPDPQRFDPFFQSDDPALLSSAARAYAGQSPFLRAADSAVQLRNGPAAADAVGHAVYAAPPVSGPADSDILKLKSDLAALRVHLAVIRAADADRKARGLPPLTEATPGWQIILKSLARFQADCHKAGFNPGQPRVPAGNSDGGQWTSEGSVPAALTAAGRNDPRVLSDAAPDNDAIPGAQYAQYRAGRGPVFVNGQWVQPTPAQAARLAVAEARAQEAISRVHEVDPKWKPSPSAYETVEGLIRAREMETEQAQFHSYEFQRHGIGPGPFAAESIPARGPERDFTARERREINRIGAETGCHTCGSLDPRTKSGNYVADHQPPTSWNSLSKAQRLYPQCVTCSAKQGYWISRNRRINRP